MRVISQEEETARPTVLPAIPTAVPIKLRLDIFYVLH